ncbi:MAG: B12-binding domain-containing radical SAM protein [Betaproteobacteria bacterium]|nr:B12-binding domain-containing radical SAM protein [Betaproteobacteria bacterium]
MKTLLLTPPSPALMNPQTCQRDLRPPKIWVPLGIAYLASSLRSAGFSAELMDMHDFSWEDAYGLLLHAAPDLVGISCFTMNRGNALHLAELAKKTLPEVVVVLGGPHATFFPEQILLNPFVDIVVLGQGEETLVELAACLSEHADLRQVRGIVFREGDCLRRTEARQNFSTLDALPFPTYEAFDLGEYKSPELPAQYARLPGTHVITSRGCPFHCKFCSVHSYFGGWHARTPENVVEELRMLMESHGVQHVYFSDDLFSLDHDRVITLCKAILDQGLQLVWMAETRVDCVSEEMLAWMRKAGCYRIYYGVESGSPRILKSVNKGFTVAQVRRAFKLTHAAGIEPCCFLMIGNPGETPATIQETISLIHEIRPAQRPVIGITVILPGTAHYALARQQGIITDEYWLSGQDPPLYTGEYNSDDLIYLQILLAQGVCPELYEHMCSLGFNENYFRLRRLSRFLSQ